MKTLSTFSNGNYEAQIAKTFDDLYTITYIIDGKVIKKTNHVDFDIAQNIAEDFVLDGGGSDPQFLSE
jgi:hypothetical protein